MSEYNRHSVPVRPLGWSTIVTPQPGVNGYTYSHYPFDQVKSAYQKSVRRGLTLGHDAYQWSLEMFYTGPKGPRTNLWNRMLVIAVEDIGPADPLMIIKIWRLFREDRDNPKAILQATRMMIDAQKCRVNDWKCHLIPELGDPKMCDQLVIDQGGLKSVKTKLIENINLKDEGWCIYWIRVLYGTTIKIGWRESGIAKNRYEIAHWLIWEAFLESEMEKKNSPFLNFMETIGMSDNWRWTDKPVLLWMHVINLWCNDCLPISIALSGPNVNVDYGQSIDNSNISNANTDNSNNNSETKRENSQLNKLDYDHYVSMISLYEANKDIPDLIGVPDVALDKHTRKGKQMGRSLAHFAEHGGVLQNVHPRWANIDRWAFEQFVLNYITNRISLPDGNNE